MEKAFTGLVVALVVAVVAGATIGYLGWQEIEELRDWRGGIEGRLTRLQDEADENAERIESAEFSRLTDMAGIEEQLARLSGRVSDLESDDTTRAVAQILRSIDEDLDNVEACLSSLIEFLADNRSIVDLRCFRIPRFP